MIDAPTLAARFLVAVLDPNICQGAADNHDGDQSRFRRPCCRDAVDAAAAPSPRNRSAQWDGSLGPVHGRSGAVAIRGIRSVARSTGSIEDSPADLRLWRVRFGKRPADAYRSFRRSRGLSLGGGEPVGIPAPRLPSSGQAPATETEREVGSIPRSRARPDSRRSGGRPGPAAGRAAARRAGMGAPACRANPAPRPRRPAAQVKPLRCPGGIPSAAACDGLAHSLDPDQGGGPRTRLEWRRKQCGDIGSAMRRISLIVVAVIALLAGSLQMQAGAGAGSDQGLHGSFQTATADLSRLADNADEPAQGDRGCCVAPHCVQCAAVPEARVQPAGSGPLLGSRCRLGSLRLSGRSVLPEKVPPKLV